MTELEKYIFEQAKPEIAKLKIRIKEIGNSINRRYLEFPFFCDGVWDIIIYDIEIKDFTKIKYLYGIGKGTIIEGSEKSGYFKKTQWREFSIAGKF